MTKQKSTKRALLLSALSLLLCVSMLIGSTFAWFTDSVTSSGNIIKSGTLDVTMEWADGKTDPANTTWTDASTGAIFNNDNWEPGYVEVRHIKIANEGSLALKYQLSIAAKKEITKLTDAIDVYYVDPAVQVADRTDLDNLLPIGTLTEVLANISTSASGDLLAGEKDTVTLALKMRESAGNEYQNLAIGSEFEIRLSAVQKDFESDSFGDDYDEGLNPAVEYVTSAQGLKDAMLIRGAHIQLQNDIVVDASTPLQWGSYMFVANGREVTIDLNGKSIVVEQDAALKTNAVFTTANGGTLNIVGDGTVEIKNSKSGIFHAMNKNDQINVYGGTYISNTDNGSDALAIIYTNSGSVDVYGGKFISPAGVTQANAEDKQGNRLCIMFHEGTLMNHGKYYEGYDATRIQLEKDCQLKEVTIDGEIWYQVAAIQAVSNVSDLNTALTGSDNVILKNCNDATAVISIPDTYTGTLIVEDSTINAISAADTANILVRGDVTVKSTNGSAITGKNIHLSGEDDATLTAIADEDSVHAYGIGGDDTQNISIKNVHIQKVSGGYIQKDFVSDTKYGKNEPEGGAAIGSGYSGANITLTNVVIDEALGGSKAAGIGAQFWTGVNITITNCEIKKAVGGNASAGIGGSRVSQNATSAEDITITIKDSTINAEGGQFAAGIGSGYDTHCADSISVLPVTTIDISGSSNITAKGGQYAAGIGTGYHTAGLEGKIENSVTVNATAGGSREKYTEAMDVGFGVFDKTREGSKVNAASTFDYKGTVITAATAPDVQ